MQADYNAAAQAISGCLNYWPLTDGAVTSFADSKGSATLAAASSLGTVTGPDGVATAAYFDATTNRVLTAASFTWPEDWSVAFWMRCDATPTGDAMAFEWNQSAFSKYVQLDSSVSSGSNAGANLYYGTPAAGPTAWTVANSNFGTTTWKFIVVTFKRSTNTMEFFVNNVSAGSQSSSVAQNTGSPGSGYLGIGGRNNAGTRGLAFDGALNGFALFNAVLTSQQRSDLMTAMTLVPHTASESASVTDSASVGIASTPVTASDSATVTDAAASLVVAIGAGVTPGSTPFGSDAFTDTTGTQLSSHSPTGGSGSWVTHPSSSFAPIVNTNRATAQSNANCIATLSVTPPSADYDVSADITLLSASGGGGVLGRFDASVSTGYYALVDGSTGQVQLLAYAGGSYVGTLGSYSEGWASGATKTLTLRMSGSTIKVLVDGVERISVTDTSATAAGHPGIRLVGTSSVGGAADNFQASYTPAATGAETGTVTDSGSAQNLVTAKSASDSATVTDTAALRANVGGGVRATVATSGSSSVVADSTSTGATFNGFPGFTVTPAGTYLVNLGCADSEQAGPFDYGTIIRRSTDAGASWTTAKTFTIAGGDCSMFCVGATIYATWINVFGADTVPSSISTDYGYFNNYWSKSTDDGVTWTTPAILDAGAVPPRDLSSGIYTLAASPSITGLDGKILTPIYRRSTSSLSDLDFYVILREYDADFTNGANRGTPFPYQAGWRYEEPCVARMADGRLICAARVTEPGNCPTIWVAFSADDGVTWTGRQRVLGTGASTSGWGGRPDIMKAPNGTLFMQARIMTSGTAGAQYWTTSTDGITWATPTAFTSGGSVGTYGAWAVTGGSSAAGNITAVYGGETSTPGNVRIQKFTETPGLGSETATVTDASSVTVGVGAIPKTASEGVTVTDTASGVAVTRYVVASDSAIVTDYGGGVASPVTTYTRPFYAPLDHSSVTAPLDLTASTAPLDLNYTETT